MVTWHLTMDFPPNANCGLRCRSIKSNGKQFTFTREKLTAVAIHLAIKWLFVFHRFDPFVLIYSKSLIYWSLGEQRILFPSNLNVSPWRGLLPEKLGGGVRPASQNPYPIYDQNLRYSLPFLWPDQNFETLFVTWTVHQNPVSDLRYD